MIDWLVNILFWWAPLREAIFAEVHMYDQIKSVLDDPESMEDGSKHWLDFDGWRGWSYDKNNRVYYFNDIPEEDMLESFKQLGILEGDIDG